MKKCSYIIFKITCVTLISLWLIFPAASSFNITSQAGFPVYIGPNIPATIFVDDINGDGWGEMIVETPKNLYLYNTSTSTLQDISALITSHQHNMIKMPNPIAGNLAGDDKLEIIFGDKDSSKLYVWNSDGLVASGFPLTLGGHIFSSPSMADVDNDGYSEIAIGCNGNLAYLIYGNGTIFTNWPVAVEGIITSKPAFGDIDGDGELEIIFNVRDNMVYAFNVNGSNVSGWPQSISSFGMTLEYSSPAVGDLDNDGIDEVVVSACINGHTEIPGRLIVFKGNGSHLWDVPINANYYSSPAIGNIDSDAENEIVIGCVFNVFAFEHNGTSKWTNSIGSIGEIYSTPLLKDITDDGISEVFVSRKNDGIDEFEVNVWGWYGDGTSFMEELAGDDIRGSPSICDFDGDGMVELVVGTDAGYIEAWNIEFIPNYPVVSILFPNEGYILNASSVNVSYKNGGNITEVNHTHLQLDNQSVLDEQTVNNTFTFENLSDGYHQIKIWYVNNSGNNFTNLEAFVQINFCVDTISPSILIEPVITPTNISNYLISGTFIETGSGINSITVNGVTATISGFNYSVNITLSEGLNTINVTALDNASNVGTNSTLIFLDTTVPIITLSGTSPIDIEVDSIYGDAGATALDNYDGNITGSIVTVNSVDNTTLGAYIVTYNVNDSLGNLALEVNRTVNIVDTTAPVITLLG
ncbi:MAG: VCBS repeat-containing protein, partial [Methanosarcinales archaeon]|nr:VCBS repeat-containing protein [Methanosarcinales archaeon]